MVVGADRFVVALCRVIGALGSELLWSGRRIQILAPLLDGRLTARMDGGRHIRNTQLITPATV
ncbi:hypothetical protein O203_01355 [Ectopseudomonas chengduensis]|nr:hypothetical protein O203_01355 [Pseudomonas chengduensis]